ncbi:DUF3231 family protein [Alkalihalobacillus sp. AL-G]|uniref:DUF3231 family protein n=1 Tax=Alkalihalobacillus sp. AL-G TaxID=2926399 RepID=UPI00272B8644|nr:DUF3231 family protein [Alkalihalobacillus sp. AL-G]WLD92606.1 DUF3231 family protein [Alkalihalobacillus sp. AL-G]
MEVEKLTPAEISNLWNSYISNTMAQNVTKYFNANAQDEELHNILEYAEEISIIEVEKSKAFLEKAKQPLPQRFEESDVDINAPAICTDNFTLLIKYKLVQDAHIVYSLSLNTSTRKDLREFYQECLKNSAELYNRLADLMIKKGLQHPEVHIPTTNHIGKVSKQSYLAGWFADRRPINTMEISQLVHNLKSTEVHKTFLKIFSQITSSNELRKHFERGVEMFQKHLDIFQSVLTENDLPKLPTWESELTDTTVSPFSDRLMLYKMTLLTSAAAGRYGSALSSVQRKDLGTHFMRIMAETLQYGEDSLNLMIERGFMDQMPMAKETPSDPSST